MFYGVFDGGRIVAVAVLENRFIGRDSEPDPELMRLEPDDIHLEFDVDTE